MNFRTLSSNALAFGFALVWTATAAAAPATLYSIDHVADQLVRIDADSGVINVVGNLGVNAGDMDLAMLGDRLFSLNAAPGAPPLLHEISPDTGHVLSTVAITLNGATLLCAEGLAMADGNLLIAYCGAPDGRSNMVGTLHTDGSVHDGVGYGVDFDGFGDDGISRVFGVNNVADTGAVDFLLLGGAQSASTTLAHHAAPAWRANDVTVAGARLYAIDQHTLSLQVSAAADGALLASIPLARPLRGLATVPVQTDQDNDGVLDHADNCIEHSNADQRDSDQDAIGNRCDADLNNDLRVDFLDLGLLKAAMYGTDADADLNGDGSVNFIDLGLFRQLMFRAPGPSGTAPLRDDLFVSDPAIGLFDPEYDNQTGRMAWQDGENSLWLASVDPLSGTLVPADGRGTLIDTELAPLGTTLNGPEWSHGPGDTSIVYTRIVDGELTLARARDAGTQWQSELLWNGTQRWSPLGSERGSAVNRISYQLDTGAGTQVAWRDLDAPESEQLIPDGSAAAQRWVEGQAAMVLTAASAGTTQVARYDLDSGTLQTLTDDEGTKRIPFMWHAPEFDEVLMLTMVARDSVGIYRATSVEGEAWTRIHLIRLPGEHAFVHSPEPFVVAGRSYVTLVATSAFDQSGSAVGQPVGPTQIWVAGIDAEAPFYRQVSEGNGATLIDPEAVELANETMIYYTEKRPEVGIHILHRARTSLGTHPPAN